MDLNTILIILGVVALLALIGHGLWSSRREKSKYFEKEQSFKAANHHAYAQNVAHQDENANQTAIPTTSMQPPAMQSTQTTVPNTATQTAYSSPSQSEGQPLSTAYAQSVSSHLESDETDFQNIDQRVDEIKISIPTQAHSSTERSRNEIQYDIKPNPVSSSNSVSSMTIEQLEENSDEFEGINSSSTELREQLAELSQNGHNEAKKPTFEKKKAAKYLMLYIVAPENSEFNGYNLSQSLENLGFIYGDKDIYHRHLDLSVASPVLFSVANIQQPGTFDHYRMAEFSTVGITLFMQLPSPGNDLVNLKMMIRAAKTLADDLGGFILTDQQEIFDDKAEQQYLEKIA